MNAKTRKEAQKGTAVSGAAAALASVSTRSPDDPLIEMFAIRTAAKAEFEAADLTDEAGDAADKRWRAPKRTPRRPPVSPTTQRRRGETSHE